MDGQAGLVAGAFASSPDRSRTAGANLLIDPRRTYDSYGAMADAEAALARTERIDFVVIVTPNHLHFPVAKRFLEAGMHVVCDKPVAFSLTEAKALRKIVARTGKVFALTHNYTGHPMVKQARALVRSGRLGELRKVVVEYAQGWLATPIEATGQKQAAWRTDPKRSGLAGCLGDIGTHAENLARYITGLSIEALCAELSTFVPGRQLNDDGSILLRFHGGAKGILHASQICVGEENNLNIRVYGTRASLEWRQESPDKLIVKSANTPRKPLRRARRGPRHPHSARPSRGLSGSVRKCLL